MRKIGSVTVYVMLGDTSCLHARARAHILLSPHEQDTWASKMDERTPSLLTKKELWKTIQLSVMLQSEIVYLYNKNNS